MTPQTGRKLAEYGFLLILLAGICGSKLIESLDMAQGALEPAGDSVHARGAA
jgi:hypothetical protein